jgi:hypothetical protein
MTVIPLLPCASIDDILTSKDPDRASGLLAERDGIPLSPGDRERLAGTLAAVEELRGA